MNGRGAGAALLCAITGSAAAGTPADVRQPHAATHPQLALVLAIEDARASHPEDLRVLIQAAHGAPLDVQVPAIRALGRLERRDVITDLVPLLGHRAAAVRAETANALAQALRGARLPGDIDNAQVALVQAALLKAGNAATAGALAAVCRSIGRLPYAHADEIRAADSFLRAVLDPPDHVRRDPSVIAAAARGLESLARRSTIAPVSDETVDRLKRLATAGGTAVPDEVGRNAMAALATARAYDTDTLDAVLRSADPEVRRIGARALAGAASAFHPGERYDLIRLTLRDSAVTVRLEGIRAWARQEAREHGCGPLLEALSDRSMHVALAAIDLLGEHCRDEEAVTDRLTAEARTPPPLAWHREAHALVALARRSPERAAVAMPAFVYHPVSHVRRYAARAAAILNDITSLQRLAADEDDNVVEAALPPLRRRLGSDSDTAFVAALGREPRVVGRHQYAYPYQVYRTAAIELKGATPTPELVAGLLRTLKRITLPHHATSRDARLALIERLTEHGSVALVPEFTRLLGDADPVVAAAAAHAIAGWTGKRPDLPAPALRRPDVKSSDWRTVTKAALVLGSGRRVEIVFSAEAPLARMRFIERAMNGYYNGLTFHRVEPNFVVQGGSPNAHEYVGDREFMRDEVGLETHRRGAVGLSTRGRDTGDAQFFINLVDNPRLDHEYTVFAHVRRDPVDQMEIVDAILEGDVITRVELIPQR